MFLAQKTYLFAPKRAFIACQLVINSVHIAVQYNYKIVSN